MSGQASALEITPEMRAAGVDTLIGCIGDDRWTGGDAATVEAIFLSMMAAKGATDQKTMDKIVPPKRGVGERAANKGKATRKP